MPCTSFELAVLQRLAAAPGDRVYEPVCLRLSELHSNFVSGIPLLIDENVTDEVRFLVSVGSLVP